MTKDKLEARVKELEELLGIKTIPTKMNEIEVLEADTMVKVLDLVRNCEKITGRELKAANDKTIFTGNVFSNGIKEQAGPLRAMVEELRDFALGSGNYSFENEDAFATWVHNKITNC